MKPTNPIDSLEYLNSDTAVEGFLGSGKFCLVLIDLLSIFPSEQVSYVRCLDDIA
jgi:hypothetical protein